MVPSRTTDGGPVRALTIIDENTGECLALYVSRRISSQDVLDQLYELFISRGTPEYSRSDNGPEFTANAVRNWLEDFQVRTLYIEPGSPSLLEARVVIEDWYREYNRVRPQSSLGYRPPAPEAFEVEKFTLGVVP